MGILGRLIDAAVEANEDAHAHRLERGWADTWRALAGLSNSVRANALGEFLVMRQGLLAELQNWSRDGRIQTARKLQDEARRAFDFNQSHSHALWMAGAWLEALARGTKRAGEVHASIESLARSLTAEHPPQSQPRTRQPTTYEIAKAPASHEQPRMVDVVAVKREVENLFYPLLKVYLFENLFGKEGEKEMRTELTNRCSDWERRLLAAMLCGLWVGVVQRMPDGDVDEKLAATSIATWFDITMQDAMAQLDDLRSGRAREEVAECLRKTAEIAARSEKVADLHEIVEAIRGWSAAG